ncbi:hypothetical protein [Macrococcoides bohemicum]|uniref:hypothetical protein n=1 Tax=Macrococcoides bohemicum TaxID=1903056 RepID=UPI002898B4A5|nr:hypothetical protein [Macrococcus bohemicus]
MVQVYDSMYLETKDGLIEQPNRRRLIIPTKHVNKDGTFNSFAIGSGAIVNEEQSLVFIVDNNVAEQAEKLKLDVSGILPKLIVKDGELIEDVLTEQQKKIMELEQRLLIERAELNNA